MVTQIPIFSRPKKSHTSHHHRSLQAADPETGSVGSGLGTLRRAHIDRTKVSRTSFYLRVGALGELYIVQSISSAVLTTFATRFLVEPCTCIRF